MAKVNFRTNVLLKSIIGKDLITDDNLAVLELVKNSFDAGSNKVNLEFRNLVSNDDKKAKKNPTEKSSKLIITDIGVGMSSYDLVNKWLNIAYSEKKQKREEYGRILAGNKGVGRFSCDRLGNYLTIYTRQKNKKYIKLFIDWKWFEKDGNINLNIQDVDLDMIELSEREFSKTTGIKPFKNGTILEISSLREVWNYDKILSLKRQLERLINPNQSFKASPFQIIIKAGEYLKEEKKREDFEKINGVVRNRIFENLDFKTTSIQSNISSDGKTISTTLQDRGNVIFELTERNKFSLLRDININIYYLNPYSKAYFTKQTGIRSVDFGSIFLFINGFRIPPYGDVGDDWLGLEIRKGQGYNRYLGTREIVGRIEIQDEHEKFKIISNRTGVVNNEYYKQLTRNTSPFGYYYKIFRRLERFVVEGIRWDAINDDERKLEKEILTDPNWNESKENYTEDQLTRNRRVIEVVKKVIDAKKVDIIKLKINTDFVKELILEQAQKVESELDEIAEHLNEKNLTDEEISSFLEKINISRAEIKNFSSIVSPYTENSKEIKKIEKELETLERKLKAVEEARQLAEAARLEAERQKREIEEALEIEKNKNTYLLATRRTLSEDADGLIHTIKINNIEIRDGIDNIIDDITSKNYSENEIITRLGNIKINAERSLKLAEIATRSDFKKDVDARDVDIVKYVTQYLDVYKDTFNKGKLHFSVVENKSSLIKKISVLNLSIVLDNLVSNSIKWKADNVKLVFKNIDEKRLSLKISDDGLGLSEKFKKMPDKIFELGVNDIPPRGLGGSGIGLFFARKLLAEMNATINFVGNGKILSGACFEIVFTAKK